MNGLDRGSGRGGSGDGVIEPPSCWVDQEDTRTTTTTTASTSTRIAVIDSSSQLVTSCITIKFQEINRGFQQCKVSGATGNCLSLKKWWFRFRAPLNCLYRLLVLDVQTRPRLAHSTRLNSTRRELLMTSPREIQQRDSIIMTEW